MKKERVNVLTSFINPHVFTKVKHTIGITNYLNHQDINDAVEQLVQLGSVCQGQSVRMPHETGCPVSRAIRRSQRYILSHQNQDGHWVAELEANTTLTSEYIMLMYFMGMVDEQKLAKAANYIVSKQNQDGSWSIFYGGEGDISTSIESYFALKLAGYTADHPIMRKARDFILRCGGIMNARVITKIILSFFGQFDWRGTPSLPVEMIFIPRLCSFNIYEFSSWARICVVPMAVLMELKPSIGIPARAHIDELYTQPRACVNFSFAKQEGLLSWHNFFVGVDRILKLLEKSPIKISKKLALKKSERWILQHQDESGDWGGIFPAKAFSIMALKMLGHSNDYPPIKKGFEAIERFQITTADYIHQQSCVSPVWDTAWSVLALRESGVRSDDPAMINAGRWLYLKQTTRTGDWKIKNPKAQPGGWAFEYFNEFYPDTDDTAAVIMALMNISGVQGVNKSQRIGRGLKWLLSMQNTDGGWGAFDKDVNNPIYNKILFNDFKTMLDPSCPDLTGRIIELLGELGYNRDFLPLKNAIQYLKNEQYDEGCWFGRWGVNFIYGTWAVLCGLTKIGENRDKDYIQRAVDWLFRIQNPDGGWGESCLSYHSAEYMGKGNSTASQTAWALLALISCGYARDERVAKGIDFLVERQLDEGTWEENEFTGTGFPRAFYIRYHMYKDYFPLLALSRYKKTILNIN